MLLLSEDDIDRLIDPMAAIEAVAHCFRNGAGMPHAEHGRLDVPRQDPKGSVLVLAGHADSLFAAKTNVHVYPDAQSRQRLAKSMMLLWDTAACEPLALLATTGFNNHRTGAGLAAGADALAAKDASTLVIFGAGKIAPATVRYMAAVRRLSRVYIFGHGSTRARELAAHVARWPEMHGVTVIADADVDAALAEADIIVTVTTSSVPVLSGRFVKQGALIILAGANRAGSREADDELMSRAQVYADDVAGCRARAGDIVMPLASGRLKPEQIVGAIGLAIAEGAKAPLKGADITVFKSMGIIEQDVAIATMLLARASAEGVGVNYDPQTGALDAANRMDLAARLGVVR